MSNIHKGLACAAMIIVMALIAKGVGVDKKVSFALVTAISGFAAVWVSRRDKSCCRRLES